MSNIWCAASQKSTEFGVFLYSEDWQPVIQIFSYTSILTQTCIKVSVSKYLFAVNRCSLFRGIIRNKCLLPVLSLTLTFQVLCVRETTFSCQPEVILIMLKSTDLFLAVFQPGIETSHCWHSLIVLTGTLLKAWVY